MRKTGAAVARASLERAKSTVNKAEHKLSEITYRPVKGGVISSMRYDSGDGPYHAPSEEVHADIDSAASHLIKHMKGKL